MAGNLETQKHCTRQSRAIILPSVFVSFLDFPYDFGFRRDCPFWIFYPKLTPPFVKIQFIWMFCPVVPGPSVANSAEYRMSPVRCFADVAHPVS